MINRPLLLPSATTRTFGITVNVRGEDGALTGRANVSELLMDDAFNSRPMGTLTVVNARLAIVSVAVIADKVLDCNALGFFHSPTP